MFFYFIFLSKKDLRHTVYIVDLFNSRKNVLYVKGEFNYIVLALGHHLLSVRLWAPFFSGNSRVKRIC